MSTDPLDALRDPAGPVDPDPAFAAQLRGRLERLLLARQTGEDMSLLTPYIAVRDARAAMDWYADVFGAQRRGEPLVGPDHRVGHAEMTIGGAGLMIADEYPDLGLVSPRTSSPGGRSRCTSRCPMWTS
ncbi:VOC family protein [Fodinicola feengrottensis]|uniref:VOC family protein n=1 Tax=Fodinicola feengrottensis TaxID=435914 RepID=UPI0013D53E7A|nr:VOC family protein [Fodinicola feengrottensis]